MLKNRNPSIPTQKLKYEVSVFDIMKIAFLGPKGSFAENAAKELFPDEELIPIQPIRKVVLAVETGKAGRCIVPLENFYNGEVIETLDALTEFSKAKIIQEKSFEIEHCLGTLPKNERISKILSKDQALSQCGRYLCEKYPEALTISTQSTSEAVERIVKENLNDAGAIASKTALLNAGFKIIAENLCPRNKTRFIVLGKEPTEPTGDDKTFLVFYPQEKDHPGTLYGNLGFFANLGINLEYIQSRPDGKGGYRFYIELEGHEKDKAVQIAIQALKYALDPKGIYQNAVQVLGSYKNTYWKNGGK